MLIFEVLKMRIDFRLGYLFRSLVNSRNIVLDDNITSAAMGERLKRYLQILHIYDGETIHGNRGACAIMLVASSAAESAEHIMNHVGWFSRSSCDYYTRFKGMTSNNSVANLFSSVAQSDSDYVAENFCKVGDKNLLSKAFV